MECVPLDMKEDRLSCARNKEESLSHCIWPGLGSRKEKGEHVSSQSQVSSPGDYKVLLTRSVSSRALSPWFLPSLVSMSLRLTQPGHKCQDFTILHQELALPKHCMGSVVSEQGFHWDNLVPWGYLVISEEFQLPPLEGQATGI